MTNIQMNYTEISIALMWLCQALLYGQYRPHNVLNNYDLHYIGFESGLVIEVVDTLFKQEITFELFEKHKPFFFNKTNILLDFSACIL